MSDGSTSVIYILGTGRCGSTVLSNLVGSSPGYVSVGEIYYIWDRGFQENRRCGCGERFLDCPFWREVVDGAGISAAEAARGLSIREQSARTRNALMSGSELEEFHSLLGRLYRAVRSVSGGAVIVDSSKFPVYSRVLAGTPDLDTFGLLLVRDPRAVAFSRSRLKRLWPEQAEDAGPAYFKQQGVIRSASTWLGWNLLAEFKWRNHPDRFARVRYEDFVKDPYPVFELIGESSGVSVRPAQAGANTFNVGPSHALSGNPVRFSTGPLELRADKEWTVSMPRSRRLAISLMTLPLLPRYGYLGEGEGWI